MENYNNLVKTGVVIVQTLQKVWVKAENQDYPRYLQRTKDMRNG